MWKKLTKSGTSRISPTNNNHVPAPVTKIEITKASSEKPSRPDPVIRASNSVSNQDFLALAVIEGNLGKVQSVVEAYTTLLGIDRGFQVVLGFLYDVNPRTMLVSTHQFEDISIENDEEMCKGLSILHLTCVFDQDHIMKQFLRFGIGFVLKASSSSKQTLIHVCSWYGNYNTMSLLIRSGLSLEGKNTKGLTPIHLATTQGHYICVQSLLKDGANPNEVDLNGNSTLHLAVISNQIECAEELFRFENVSTRANE